MEGPARAPERVPLIVASIVLTLALTLGGGGKRFPLAEMIVEPVALVGLLYGLWLSMRNGWRPGTRLGGIIALLLALLVAAQIVPLPAAIWAGLPGRTLATDVLAANGLSLGARPLSLDPEATIRSGLALLPAFALFVLTLQLSASDRLTLVRIVLALALVSLALGTLQFTLRSQALYPFSIGHFGYPVGLFSNRNHQATFLLMATVFAALFIARDGFALPQRSRLLVSVGLLLAFSIGTVATFSRMGTVLLPLAWIGFALLVVPRGARRLRWLLLPTVGLLVLGAFIASQSGTIRNTLARFDTLEDSRFSIWRDTRWSIDQYLPAGSGIGTFEKIHAMDQTLGTVFDLYVNHAHNEYLETLLEAGIAAPILLAIFLVFLGRAALASRHDPGRQERAFAIAGFTIIGLAMAHSLVDYPLRTLSIVALFGMACALILPPSPGRYKG